MTATLSRSTSAGSTCPPGWPWSTSAKAPRTASIVLSVRPMTGIGTGSLMSSEGAISSAFARATTSERLSRARSPSSMRDRCDLLIPANPATTTRDLPRVLRICRIRRPIVRASSASHQDPLLIGPLTARSEQPHLGG